MISAFIISVALVVAGDQPPAPAPVATGTPAAATVEPKMICKNEFATGSRVKKIKVCRPEGQAGLDQETALQREINRMGDMRNPGETGGGVSSGSGIGN